MFYKATLWAHFQGKYVVHTSTRSFLSAKEEVRLLSEVMSRRRRGRVTRPNQAAQRGHPFPNTLRVIRPTLLTCFRDMPQITRLISAMQPKGSEQRLVSVTMLGMGFVLLLDCLAMYPLATPQICSSQPCPCELAWPICALSQRCVKRGVPLCVFTDF